MRGVSGYATAVREADGEIAVESGRLKPAGKWSKIPILRGIVNFFNMLVFGMKITMRSAEVFSGELEAEEPSKFEKWLAKTFHIDVMTVAMVIGVVLGLGLSVLLFFMLPTWITGWITQLAGKEIASIWFNLLEGLVRIAIFIGYMLLTSVMKDIRRLYQYHGAEHKTIACFEHGLPLTVENAKKMSKHHDRCGTNFIVIVMIISILMFSLIEWLLGLCGFVINDLAYSQPIKRLIRIAIKLAMLPIIAGISYEVLKFLAKFDNWFSKALKAPGMLIQRITTREPEDDMLEVAIKAFETVQLLDEDPNLATEKFPIVKSYVNLREKVLSYLSRVDESEAKADWIFTEILGVKRSELTNIKTVTMEQNNKILSIAKRVANGEPLQYVCEKAYFYGRAFYVDENVLIPRQDTEILVEKALEYVKDDSRILDVCTGSGCIGITVSLEKNVVVTLSDISKGALSVAKGNAQALGARVELVESDMFKGIKGTYDVILANPPYISEKDMEELPVDVKKEPRQALFGGADGLDFYRTIASSAPLSDNGVIIMEIGDNEREGVEEIFKDFDTETIKDYNGKDRVIIAKRK